MIKLQDKSISIYKGDYRPVKALKNGEEIYRYNVTGTNVTEAEFEKTYNDYLSVYGKSGYGSSKNLCPPPKSRTTNDGIIYTKITKKADGKFDLEVKRVDTDNSAMIMSPTILHSAKLPAGTYTASSNSSYIGIYTGDEDLLTLPYTFTLDSEKTINFATYDIGIKETSIYIQIEKGETATEYQHYFDPEKDPSPENIKPIISSGGKVETFGQNLFRFPKFETVSTQFLKFDYDKFNQTITINGEVSTEKTDLGTQVTLANDLEFEFSENDPICISRHIVSGSLETSGTAKVLWGIFTNGVYSGNYYSGRIIEQEGDIFEKDKYINTKFPIKKSYYNLLLQALTGKNGKIVFDNFVVKIQVMKGQKEGIPYVPYFEPSALEVSLLNGLIGAKQPNYKEQTNEQEIYYLSDALEGSNFVKSVGEKIFTGNDNFNVYNELDKTIGFITVDAKCGNGTKAASLCNAFTTLDSVDTDEEGVFITEEGRAIFRLNKERGIISPDGFKGMIEDYEYAGVPITVLYPLKEAEKTVAENPLKTYPYFTRVKSTTEESKIALGLESCIKIEESY